MSTEPTGSIPAYGRWTAGFPVASGVKRVKFVAPDGQCAIRPTFRHQPVSFKYDAHGYETVSPTGDAVLQVRFTPELPGVYRYRALNGTIVVAEGSFECVPSEHPGYVQVSQRDPRYFACSDSRSYGPIGLHMVEVPMYPRPQGAEHFFTD